MVLSTDGKEVTHSKVNKKNNGSRQMNQLSTGLLATIGGKESSEVIFDSSSDDEIEYSDLSDGDNGSRVKGTLRRRLLDAAPKLDMRSRFDHEKDKGRFRGVNLGRLAAPLRLPNFDQREPELTTKAAVSDIEKLAQKSGKNTEHERFRVVPGYAYPKVKFNREELRKEVNKQSSYFHDLRGSSDDPALLGSFYLEVLQCFGIPRSEELLKETSAFCLSVCGSCAFKTDAMPPVANPMWLSKMRRACIFPLYEGYAN
eukprot:scaffold12671_cov100-Cylindrotheca_fusiformis.AAC.3